jgi:hypothetical protein
LPFKFTSTLTSADTSNTFDESVKYWKGIDCQICVWNSWCTGKSLKENFKGKFDCVNPP